MRFNSAQKSKTKNRTTYTFTIGEVELRLLFAIVDHYRGAIPHTFELSPTIARLNDFRRKMDEAHKQENGVTISSKNKNHSDDQ